MANRVGAWGDSARRATQSARDSFCWLVFLVSLTCLLYPPILNAAKDDVSAPIAVPLFRDFKATIVPSATVTVPRVTGQQWQKATEILRQAGLTTQEFPLFRDSPKPDNTVIDQMPEPGKKVQRGSSVTLTVSRQKLPADIKLSITGPREVRQGDSATYSARVSPQVPGAKVLYRFSLGKELITQWLRTGSVSHPFRNAGSTSVVAEARVALGDQRKTLRPAARQVLVNPRAPPEISISPKSRQVERGASVRFTASVRTDVPVDLVWDGPAGERRGVKTYDVDTRGISSGSHNITLTARSKGVKDVSARARLIVDESLATVPDLRGALWSKAKGLLETHDLTTQEFPLFRESIEPDNTIVAQEPPPGSQVNRGSSVTLTVARQTLPDLTVNVIGPVDVRQGDDPSRYRAELSRQIPGADVLYRFYEGPRPITGWVRTPSVEHVFPETGTTSIIVETRVELNEQRKTPRGSLADIHVRPPPLPIVSITPDRERVEQGAMVRFTAEVEAEMPVELLWEGPLGQRQGIATYAVDTREVPPGTHEIILTAHAKGIEPVAARASLTVEERYRPPQANIETITPRVAIGEPVELRGRYEVDPRYDAELQWEGAGGTRGQLGIMTMDSVQLGLGEHAFDFVVRDGRGTARDSTTVEVYTPLDPPLARIDPPAAEVMQGDAVVFHDVSPRENRGELVPTWLLPGDLTRSGRRLDLNTSEWSPGVHEIVLRLDGPYRRRDLAKARLEVTGAYRPPRAAIDPPEGYRVELGEPASFTDVSRTDGRLPVARRWAGPADAQGDADSLHINTAMFAPGDYQVSLTVRDARGEDTARVPLIVLAPPPLPELRIEPANISVIRGQRVDFSFSATPAEALIGDPVWSGPQGEHLSASTYAFETRALPSGRHEVELAARDDRQRPLLAVAYVDIEDPVVALSVDRAELPPGESAVFAAKVSPQLPGAQFWVRIDGAEGIHPVDINVGLTHQFPNSGTYTAVLIAERDGLQWESKPVRVVVDSPIWPKLGPWLGGVAALIVGGVLAWRRFRSSSANPVRVGVRFEATVRSRPDRSLSEFGTASRDLPEVALAVVRDRGVQVTIESEEQNGEPGDLSGT